MPMQNPERVVTKQDLKDFYDQIYPYLGGSSSSGVSETMVAPVEADATGSSKAYAIGEQLILDGTLYKATAAISIGDALTVGTNIALADDLTTQIDSKADSSDITGKADKVTSATNGNFAGLDANGNLTDSGSKASDFLTQHQDITGKADKVANATNGNFAGLDSNGNLTDSGKKASDFLTQHQDISGKADKVSGATNGHLASLDSNGNLADSGKAASDFVTALSAATASTNGQVKYNYTKAGTDTGVSASVYGWNPLVGKWTAAVTALTSATSVSLTNPFSTASVDVFPVCENSSGTPITVTKITATTSTIKLTFSALTEQTSFKALVKANA